jgi:hypothetical protein
MASGELESASDVAIEPSPCGAACRGRLRALSSRFEPPRRAARISPEPECWPVARTPWWSWRESNPRPSRGHRPRYDHSRTAALRLPRCRVSGPEGPAAWSFPGVSGLSHRQRSLPAVLHRFCCRAAMDWPRVPSLVAMCLGYLIRSGSESEVVVGLCLGAPFKESEQLRSHVRIPSFTSKPISPVSGPPSRHAGRRVSRNHRRTGSESAYLVPAESGRNGPKWVANVCLVM